MPRFEFEVVTVFRESGLDGLVQRTRAELERLSRTRLGPNELAGQVSEVRAGAERGVESLKRTGEISGQDYQQALAALTRTFRTEGRGVSDAMRDISQRIRSAYGGNVPGQQAYRDAARASSNADLLRRPLAAQITEQRRAQQQAAELEASTHPRNVADVRQEAQYAAEKRRQQIEAERYRIDEFRPYVGDQARLNVEKRQQAANIGLEEQRIFTNDPRTGNALIASEGTVAAMRKNQAAQIEAVTQEQLAADTSYIEATAQARNARAKQALEIGAAEHGLTRTVDPAGNVEGDQQLRGRVLLAEKNEKLAQQIRIQQAIVNDENGIREAIVQERVLQREANQLIERQVREQRKQNAGGQVLPGGSQFQRLQAYIHSRQSGDVADPTQMLGLGQFAASRALTTVGFAASGAALYGAISSVRELIKAGEDLDKVFGQVHEQFVSLGQGNEFAGFRSDMLGIARDTGVAADQVATIGFQMKGAFKDTDTAVKETSAAIKIATVTGLENSEVVDSLTAAAISLGVSVEDIGDKALGVQNRFGVMAKETIKVFGDLGSSAAEAFGKGPQALNEIAGIIGAIQQRSGRSGSAIAENLNRVLPAIQQQASGILRLYDSNPAIRGNRDKVAAAFRAGETGTVLTQLIRDYGKLDVAQQKYLAFTLGGSRNAAAISAMFQGSSDAVREFGGNLGDTGEVEQRFDAIQKTLQQTLARAREEFRQLGDSLARAGLLDGLKLIAGAGLALLEVVGTLARMFGDLNQTLHGIPGTLLGIALAVKAVTAALAALEKYKAARVGGDILSAAEGGVGGRATGPTGGSPLALLGEEGGAVAGGGFLARVRGGGAGLAGRGAGLLQGLAGAGAGAAGTGIGANSFIGAKVAGATGGAATLAGAGVLALLVADYEGIKFAAHQREEYKKKIEASSKQIESKLHDMSLVDIEKAAKRTNAREGGVGGLLQKAGALVTGTKTSGELFDKARNDATLTEFQAAADAGIITGLPKNLLRDLQKNKGGGTAGARARKLLADLPKEQRKQVQDLARGATDIKNTQANGGADQIATVDEAKNAFAAGETSFQQLIDVYDAEIKGLKDSGGDQQTNALHTQYLQMLRERNKTIEDNIVAEGQFVSKLAQLSGAAPEAVIPALHDAMSQTTNVNTREQIAEQISSAQQSAFANAISNAGDAVEAANIGRTGVALDPEAQAAYAAWQMQVYKRILFPTDRIRATVEQQKQLDKQAFDQIMTQAKIDLGRIDLYRDPTEQAADNLRTAIANRDRPGATVPEKQAAELQIQQVQRDVAANNDARTTAVNTLAASQTQDPVKIALNKQKQALDNLHSAQRRGDPTEILNAQAAVNDAQHAVVDSQNAVTNAYLSAAAQNAQNDVVGAARVAQQQADQMARQAHGAADQITAVAARQAADRQMADAIRHVQAAQSELVQAMLGAAGDTVGAAVESAAQAQRELQDLLARRAGGEQIGDEVIKAAQTAKVNADANARRTNLQNQRDIIEFNLTMERITVGQAIAQLQELLKIADPAETRDILQRIKALTQTDMQMNLPADIKLPTLYEARRLNQSPGGYQDNRNIVVNFQANNAGEAQALMSQLSDVVNGGGANRYGVRGGLY